jgi:hypothetical protein
MPDLYRFDGNRNEQLGRWTGARSISLAGFTVTSMDRAMVRCYGLPFQSQPRDALNIAPADSLIRRPVLDSTA